MSAGPGPAAIDHLLTFVPSLEAAAAGFARLGFQPSPISRIDAMGISNHLILMRPRGEGRANYIELMSPHDPTRVREPMRSLLAGTPGARSMVLASEDIGALHARIEAAALRASAPVHIRREWRIPGEASVFPEFDVILPVDAALRFNACQYRDASLYTRTEWLRHPNGARRMSTIFAAAGAGDDVGYFAEIFGRDPQRLANGALLYPTAEIDLLIFSPALAAASLGLSVEPAAPAYLGYAIEVASLDQVRAALVAGGVPWANAMGGIRVDPEHAFGNVIVFNEAR